MTTTSPYLTGHHAPNRFEADAPDLVVTGELPADLAGVFYRNGAEPLYPPTEEEYHWFDGNGMVYALAHHPWSWTRAASTRSARSTTAASSPPRSRRTRRSTT